MRAFGWNPARANSLRRHRLTGANEMTTTGTHTLGTLLCRLAVAPLLTVGLFSLLGPVPTAHADATDDAFLGALKAKGIKFGASKNALIAAHEVCDELESGKTPTQVASTVQTNSDLDGYHAGYFVGASIRAYCPQYSS